MEKEKKKQLIRTAAKRFEKHGIKKTTLDEIARDLRITKATIYHYFKSKEELFHSTLEWETEQFIEELNNIFSSEGLNLIESLKKYLDFKESLDQKYILIYRLALSILKEENFENEESFLKDLIKKEEESISKLFVKFAVNKKSLPESFSGFLVKQSWGYLLSNKLYSNLKSEESIKKKEILLQLIGNMLA